MKIKPLQLLDIQSFPLEVKNQIEQKINEIIDWCNDCNTVYMPTPKNGKWEKKEHAEMIYRNKDNSFAKIYYDDFYKCFMCSLHSGSGRKDYIYPSDYESVEEALKELKKLNKTLI
jgi:hypothetical protein